MLFHNLVNILRCNDRQHKYRKTIDLPSNKKLMLLLYFITLVEYSSTAFQYGGIVLVVISKY